MLRRATEALVNTADLVETRHRSIVNLPATAGPVWSAWQFAFQVLSEAAVAQLSVIDALDKGEPPSGGEVLTLLGQAEQAHKNAEREEARLLGQLGLTAVELQEMMRLALLSAGANPAPEPYCFKCGFRGEMIFVRNPGSSGTWLCRYDAALRCDEHIAATAEAGYYFDNMLDAFVPASETARKPEALLAAGVPRGQNIATQLPADLGQKDLDCRICLHPRVSHSDSPEEESYCMRCFLLGRGLGMGKPNIPKVDHSFQSRAIDPDAL